MIMLVGSKLVQPSQLMVLLPPSQFLTLFFDNANKLMNCLKITDKKVRKLSSLPDF